MKIYKLSQSLNDGYDTYDSAVVCAENEEDARHIHPSEFVTHYKDGKWYGTYSVAPYSEYETENGPYADWVQFDQIDKITVEYLGEAVEGIKRGIILSSF